MPGTLHGSDSSTRPAEGGDTAASAVLPLGNQGTHATAWWHPQMLSAALPITPDYELRLFKASEVVSANQNQHFCISFLQRCVSVALLLHPIFCNVPSPPDGMRRLPLQEDSFLLTTVSNHNSISRFLP